MSLQSAWAVGTGLSNFHRMTVSVLEAHFRKFLPRIISYRDFSDYKNTNFINSLNELHLEEERRKYGISFKRSKLFL